MYNELAKQAKVEPNALAICASNNRPTYSKLGMLSSRLADRLVPFRVKREEVMRLWFGKLTHVMLVMLVVLKVVGAFVVTAPLPAPYASPKAMSMIRWEVPIYLGE